MRGEGDKDRAAVHEGVSGEDEGRGDERGQARDRDLDEGEWAWCGCRMVPSAGEGVELTEA